ncbi:nucleotidyltransferase family protein [Desulfurispira natronophila]|uniref:Polymerase nucleotidyl transferase domain-containing protein n=1 Tax=Desulfurispira natronophila TaxID=682562 RepID=A0A7W7Y4I4_9BACT|nr:nucleotidyltransferase domain-containing protein [Desulfurispira natronophila]MBB5021951.1 hypothetical protein [Desulfurispira natronophila]
MDRSMILDFLRNNKDTLAQEYGVVKIGLFGSYANELQHEGSDIDIAIVTNKKDYFNREDLREYLEHHFGASVDIGYLDSFRSYYRAQIEKEIIYV